MKWQSTTGIFTFPGSHVPSLESESAVFNFYWELKVVHIVNNNIQVIGTESICTMCICSKCIMYQLCSHSFFVLFFSFFCCFFISM